MKKFLALALTFAMLCTILVGCAAPATTEPSDEGTDASETPTAEPVELIYSSPLAPTDPFALGEALFCELVGEISGGQLTVSYFGNSSLYNQSENTAAFLNGSVDFIPGTLEDFDDAPEYSMFRAAYIFDDIEHGEAVYESELGAQIFDDVAEKVGMRMLGSAFYQTRQVNLTDKVDASTINGPEDMNDVLLRMPSGAAWTALGEAIGATPTPVNLSETYMALQTGMVDGQDNGLATTKANSFDELTATTIMTDHFVYFMHIAINEDRWQSLTEEQQGWLQQAADEAHAYITETAIQAEQDLVADFEAQGIEIIYPEKQPWIDYAAAYYQSDKAAELTSTWDWDLYEELRSYT